MGGIGVGGMKGVAQFETKGSIVSSIAFQPIFQTTYVFGPSYNRRTTSFLVLEPEDYKDQGKLKP
jgi:hypothetical protein